MSLNEFTTFANRDVNNLIFTDYKTDKPFMNVDYANVTTTDMTGETNYAYGGSGHPQLVAFNGERKGTLKIETQMQTAKLYSMMSGADIKKTANWLKREEVTATEDGNLTLSAKPIANTVNVYAIEDDCGTAIVSTVADKTVTGEGITANKAYVVYYQVELQNVQNVPIKSTTFPKVFKIYGETWNKTKDDEIIAQKMVVYKAQPQPAFSVSHANSGDPATITITLDILTDKNHNQLDLIFEEDES